MSHRFLALAMVVLIPAGIVGAEPAQRGPASPEKKVCRTDTTIGTRLGNTRRCLTRSERDALKAEARRTVERIQMQRPLVCDGPGGVIVC